ncbi:hypothetical protein [Streptomyces sp. 351MFTsu5.1]|uniref:hypothetical protein n=1 Tax=Streptomyces sp. 351MFTsu5.1 TaxID=1172180 RepID=UPI003B635D86
MVHTSAGGYRVRLRFDNTFAAAPVRIGAASVAVRAVGAAARERPVAVTFARARGVGIPAGAQAFSDPLGFAVPAGTDLLVSFHLPGTVTAAPVRRLGAQRSYVSGPGDHVVDFVPSVTESPSTTTDPVPAPTSTPVSSGRLVRTEVYGVAEPSAVW